MQIIKQSSNQIVIGTDPPQLHRLIMPTIMVAGFSLVWLSMMVSGLGVTKLSCDRPEPQMVNCKFSKSKFLGLIPELESSDRFIRSVKLDKTEEKDSDGDIVTTYFLKLLTKTGESKLLETRDDLLVKDLYSSLTQFLASQSDSLNYIRDYRLSSINYNSLVIMVFIWMMYFVAIWAASQSLEVSLDKSQNIIVIAQKSIFGKKQSKFPLTEILKIEVLAATDSYDNTSYQPVILMRSLKKYELGVIPHRDAAIIVANQLRDFLGFPSENTVIDPKNIDPKKS
jgi:hypothetical protein